MKKARILVAKIKKEVKLDTVKSRIVGWEPFGSEFNTITKIILKIALSV